MKTLARLILLVVLLNLVRYLVGGPIEAVTVMEPMHRVLSEHPEVFDDDFTSGDLAISLGYNFLLWFWATVVFHLLRPVLHGPLWVRSLASYGLMAAFFCSLAAVYMNHYTAEFRAFYAWSMADALLLFGLIGLANAWLYPRFFRTHREAD